MGLEMKLVTACLSLSAVQQILGVIIPRMKDFHDLLIRPPNVPAMLTTAGCLDPPLGCTRLQVVKLFCALLQCNDARVNRQVAELKTFSTLMDLFFKFPWNNFLHSQVEGCVSAAVSTTVPVAVAPSDGNSAESSESTDDRFSLKYHILHDCHLVQRLLEGDEDNQKRCSEPRGQRQGYMGHLMKIVNLIMQCGEADQNLAHMLRDAMEEDVQKRWNDFLSSTVADTNKKNETNLGGTPPMTSSMDDSDDEFDQLAPPDNELDKAYQHYQEVKYVNAMVDDFGVDDELRSNEELYSGTFSQLMNIACTVTADEEQSQSASLFEAACAEKIQQFDDSESDEEESSAWADREVTFTSPLDRQSSMSSDEEESSNRQREFQTSFEDDNTKSTHQSALYMTTSPNTLSQITAKASDDSDKMDISSPYNASTSWQAQEDLSGVTPMDTAAGLVDWNKEHQGATSPNTRSNWADFSSFTTQPEQHSPESKSQLDNSHHQTAATQQEGDIQSPPKHDTTQYRVLSMTPEKEEIQDPSSVNVENIELTVMDDISSPLVPSNSGKDNSSSDEEGGDSSGSEEDRSSKYVLNTSSEGEHLLKSPTQSAQQPSPSANMDSGLCSDASSPQSGQIRHPNGVGVHVTPQKAKEKTDLLADSVAESQQTQLISATSNSHDHLHDGHSEAATAKDNANLSQNFDFLSQQGLLHGDTKALTDEHRVEKKRLEAMEVCKQYDQEVQGSQGVDVS